jgi:hypothetical protein
VVDEVDQSDLGVVELLAAGVVEPHVVGRPPGADSSLRGGQLAGELVEVLVVRVSAGFGAFIR